MPRRNRYQFGSVELRKRTKGADVWVFRYWDRQNPSATRPSITLGTVKDYPTQADARRAAGGLRLEINHGLPSLMYRLFEKAMLWELIPPERNPMGLVELKGVSKRLMPPRILTEEEFAALLSQLVHPYRCMVLLAGCTGLRVSGRKPCDRTSSRFGDFKSRWRPLV